MISLLYSFPRRWPAPIQQLRSPNSSVRGRHISFPSSRIFFGLIVRVGVRSPGGSIYWRILIEKLCAFVENRTFEPLEIPKIPTIYHNDPFLRARKKFGLHIDLKMSSAAGGKPESPPTSAEMIAAREAAGRVQAEVEEEREAPIRKSKRLAKGKSKKEGLA